jgi:hypothetical protein
MTKFARAAREKRIDRYPSSIVGASNELVTHDQWRYPKTRALDAVKFAPTDAGALDVHDDFAIFGRDVVDILDFHYSWGTKHQCFHNFLRAIPRLISSSRYRFAASSMFRITFANYRIRVSFAILGESFRLLVRDHAHDDQR